MKKLIVILAIFFTTAVNAQTKEVGYIDIGDNITFGGTLSVDTSITTGTTGSPMWLDYNSTGRLCNGTWYDPANDESMIQGRSTDITRLAYWRNATWMEMEWAFSEMHLFNYCKDYGEKCIRFLSAYFPGGSDIGYAESDLVPGIKIPVTKKYFEMLMEKFKPIMKILIQYT